MSEVVHLKTKQDLSKQNERVLTYLQAGNVIDPLQSWQQIGVYRLAARIHELINLGYPVKKEWRKVFNRYGEPVKVRVYWL